MNSGLGSRRSRATEELLAAWWHRRRHRRRRRKRDGCDGCDGCDIPGCDIFLLVLAPLLLLPGRSRRVDRARPVSGPRPSRPARAGLLAIRGYQRWIGPRLSVRCRLEPSCSRFGADAVGRYGLVGGARMTAERIAECGRVARAECACQR